eukprot:765218-Hanusia_phi.AAC.5
MFVSPWSSDLALSSACGAAINRMVALVLGGFPVSMKLSVRPSTQAKPSADQFETCEGDALRAAGERKAGQKQQQHTHDITRISAACS